MALDASLVGRRYPTSAAYLVGEEKVREFRNAIGEPVGGADAPPTFAFVVAWRSLEPLLSDPELGIALERVVHGAQRFALTRALRVDDRVTGTATVESVRVLGGAAVVGARVDLAAGDETLGSAWSTLVISPASAS